MSGPAQPGGPGLVLGIDVVISPDARIHPSVRGSRIVIGDHSRIFDFACIRAVGGTGDIVLGRHCYVNPGCVLYSGNGITVGDDVLLAPGVMLMPTNHASARRDVPIRLQGFAPSKGGLFVGDGAWLGANCVVLDGARIGQGAILAAGSVVSGEVPAFEIWGGTPARKLKDRE